MKEKKKRILIKTVLCFFYLLIIGILSFCSFRLYQEKEEIKPFSKVESTIEYTYLEFDHMSEEFAHIEDSNIGFHFVSYGNNYAIIAIHESELETYKAVLDYTSGKTTKKPDTVLVFGYPVKITKEWKDLAIQNSGNFIPQEKNIVISEDNYEDYYTDCYLDTTLEKEEDFNIILFVSLLLLFVVFVLLFLTIIDKDKIVDNITEKEEL